VADEAVRAKELQETCVMAKQIFISPTIDYVFKKIFGSDRSEDIPIGFLNAIVYNGESVISSLTIVNPYNQE